MFFAHSFCSCISLSIFSSNTEPTTVNLFRCAAHNTMLSIRRIRVSFTNCYCWVSRRHEAGMCRSASCYACAAVANRDMLLVLLPFINVLLNWFIYVRLVSEGAKHLSLRERFLTLLHTIKVIAELWQNQIYTLFCHPAKPEAFFKFVIFLCISTNIYSI